MTMRATVLTTDTPHHRSFAFALAEHGRLERVIVETAHAKPPFETFHPYETERDAYERETLPGATVAFSELGDVEVVDRVDDALPLLTAARPDVIVVFGTGKLSAKTIDAAGLACLNLHGGNPEQYRGLDTHLWSVYHRDFAGLVTALHHVDVELDTGDLVALGPVPIVRGMHLHELRAANTRVCTELTLAALDAFDDGSIVRTPQRERGRYYSFVPSVLKDRCVREFERHTSAL